MFCIVPNDHQLSRAVVICVHMGIHCNRQEWITVQEKLTSLFQATISFVRVFGMLSQKAAQTYQATHVVTRSGGIRKVEGG